MDYLILRESCCLLRDRRSRSRGRRRRTGTDDDGEAEIRGGEIAVGEGDAEMILQMTAMNKGGNWHQNPVFRELKH
eukprot:1042940-Amorphochlora_amoeboformis.AAC.1